MQGLDNSKLHHSSIHPLTYYFSSHQAQRHFWPQIKMISKKVVWEAKLAATVAD